MPFPPFAQGASSNDARITICGMKFGPDSADAAQTQETKPCKTADEALEDLLEAIKGHDESRE